MTRFLKSCLGLLLALEALAVSAAETAADPTIEARRLTPQQAPLANLVVPASDLEVGVWMNRPDNLYVPGETATLYIRVNQPAYIAVYNVDAAGATSTLLPNGWENAAAADAAVFIPAAGVRALPAPERRDYVIGVDQPYGSNLIKVIASSQPFSAGRAAQPKTFASNSAEIVAKHLQAVGVVCCAVTPPTPAPAPVPTAKFATTQISLGVIAQRPGMPVAVTPAPVSPTPVPVAPVPPTPAPVTPAPLPPVAQFSPDTLAVLDGLPGTAAFGLKVATDKPAYRPGEPIRLELAAETSCSLALAALAPDGTLNVLYPNAATPELRLKKGETVFLPAAGATQALAAEGPAGQHAFVALCAEKKSFFESLFGRSAETSARAAFVPVAGPTLTGFIANTGSGQPVGRRAVIYAVTP